MIEMQRLDCISE